MIAKNLLALASLPALLVFSSTNLLSDDHQWPASKSNGKVKVFILAGQSNLEGRGFPEPLTWQVTQEKYRDRYTHFIQNGDFAAFTKKVPEPRRFRPRPIMTFEEYKGQFGKDYRNMVAEVHRCRTLSETRETTSTTRAVLAIALLGRRDVLARSARVSDLSDLTSRRPPMRPPHFILALVLPTVLACCGCATRLSDAPPSDASLAASSKDRRNDPTIESGVASPCRFRRSTRSTRRVAATSGR